MNENDKRWIKLMEYGQKIGCHQKSERSFFYKGYQFPVCARCTGIILGEFIAVIMLILKVKINITIAVLFLLAMGIDGTIQLIGILESTNIRRLITGFGAGIGLTYIYYYIYVELIALLSVK